MPVHRKTKDTTSTPDPSTSDPSSLVVLEQHVFHQYLRGLAQSAVRIVLETVMREELDQFIGAAWGESSPKRKGYRNGHYTRDLVTSTGRLEDINVPQDRAGQFHTQAFERYRRYEPHIAEGLTQMFVAGVSTHKVGEVAETLMGVAPSASTICPLPGWSAFQHSSWEKGRFHHHFNGLRCRSGGQQRGVGTASLRRGGQRWLGLPPARPAFTRRNSHRPHRDRWA
jgi:putative transposase